jgi:hypothetical protein
LISFDGYKGIVATLSAISVTADAIADEVNAVPSSTTSPE